jgi:hypothetical protein
MMIYNGLKILYSFLYRECITFLVCHHCDPQDLAYTFSCTTGFLQTLTQIQVRRKVIFKMTTGFKNIAGGVIPLLCFVSHQLLSALHGKDRWGSPSPEKDQRLGSSYDYIK